MAEGHLYDGHSAVRHLVQLGLLNDELHLSMEGWEDRIAAADLVLEDRSPSGITVARRNYEGWRLRIPAPVPAEIHALFPRRHSYGAWIDRVGLWRAVAAFTIVSGLVVALGYIGPTLLAPLVPQSVEKAYGAAMVGDFGGKYCSTPLGDRALRRLVARLDATPQDLNVRVVDIPIVNAAALPAGNIVLFDKLFETVETPEELAGVLAHEIAHVRRRHVTAALIRQFGVSIFATALGGTAAGRVDGLVTLNFTHRAEGDADGHAIELLQGASISPRPTAAFFKRMRKTEGNLGKFEPALAYLSSHPLSRERQKRFEQAAKPGGTYTPALTEREWTELRAICSSRSPGR